MVEYFTGAVNGAALVIVLASLFDRYRVSTPVIITSLVASVMAYVIDGVTGYEPISHWGVGLLIGAVLASFGFGVRDGMALPNRSEEYDETIKAAQEAKPQPISDTPLESARPASCPCGDALCLKYGCPYSPEWKGDGCR